MPAYNGHHCRACWNASLWITNDEGLYRRALEHKRSAPTLALAARRFLDELPRATPDGFRYTFTGVRSALAGLE